MPPEYSLEDVITPSYELMMMTKIQLKLLLNNKIHKSTFKNVILLTNAIMALHVLEQQFSSLETTYRNF